MTIKLKTRPKALGPRDIYEYINNFVVGQDYAKKVISNALFMHYVRTFQYIEMEEAPTKSNVMLLGPSGSGKTLIAKKGSEALSKLSGIDIAPMLEIDCNNLSATGWVGDDLRDMISDHIKNCREDINNTSIIFLDEVDKLCIPATDKSGNDHNKNTQYGILKILEGMPISLKSRLGGFSNAYHSSKLLFILAGNFPQIRHKRVSNAKCSVGFKDTSDKLIVDPYKEIEDAGMVTQLLGRIATIAELDPLSKSTLRIILRKHILPEYQSTWEFIGQKLEINNYQIGKITEEACKKGTGARGLTTALEQYLEDKTFNLKP